MTSYVDEDKSVIILRLNRTSSLSINNLTNEPIWSPFSDLDNSFLIVELSVKD